MNHQRGNKIGQIIAVVFSAGLYLWVSLTSFSTVDGWSYFPFGIQDLLPYRDYYFPVTPLLYFEAQIAKIFTQELIFFRISLIVFPVIFALSSYYLASRFLKPVTSTIFVIFFVSLISSTTVEPPIGWNTQSQILMTTGLALFVGSTEFLFSTKSFSSKRISFLAYLSGLFASFALLAKQSVLINLVVVFLAATLWFYLFFRSKFKEFSIVLLKAFSSFTLVQLVFLTWLLTNGAFSAFLGDMFSFGGKNLEIGSFSVGIFKLIWTSATTPPTPLVILAGVLLALLLMKRHQLEISHFILAVFSGVSSFVFAVFLDNAGEKDYKIFILSFFIGFSAYFCSKFTNEKLAGYWIAISSFVFIFVGSWYRSKLEISEYLVEVSTRFTAFWSLFIPAIVVLIPLFLKFFGSRNRERNLLSSNFSDDIHSHSSSFLFSNRSLFLLTLGFFSSLSSILSGLLSTKTFISVMWFIPGPIVLFAWVVALVVSKKNLRVVLPSLYTFVAISSIIFSALVVIRPFHWWTWSEPRSNFMREEVHLGYLDGLYLSEKSANFYQSISDSILVSSRSIEQTLGIPQEKQLLFAFPYLSSAYSVSNLSPYINQKCVLIWFDLCPNNVIEESLAEFKLLPPNVVVWQTPSEEAMQNHESTYVEQQSSIRKWIAYKEQQVELGHWRLTRMVVVPASSDIIGSIEIYQVLK